MKRRKNETATTSFILGIRALHRHLRAKPRLTRKEKKLLRALEDCYYVRPRHRLRAVLIAGSAAVVTICLLGVLL